jgi:DNA primase
MDNTAVQDVKSRLNIVDVVGAYLRLTKSGTHWKAPCPFHNEKTPSFMVNEERQIWHCFGCGKGGDAFSFVMEIEGVEFAEALSLLAERAGVDLRQYRRTQNAFEKTSDAEPDRSREILELSTKFYEKQLWAGVGKEKILGYLHDRGITDESIRMFRLGYAPEGWRHLLDFLVARGYRAEELEKAGLVIRKSQEAQSSDINYPASSSYDRFRDRVMFPITDVVGRVIGYSARVAPGGDESQAKYINTPETGVYRKSKVLYGIAQAKQAMKEQHYTVLVEGNMDVIAMHQAGARNTVAVSGTALTSDHLDILKRYGRELRLFFDMDGAGQAAAWKSALSALDREVSVSIVSIPLGKDAADAAKEDPEKLIASVSHPTPAAEYFLAKFLAEDDVRNPDGKRRIAEKYAPMILAMRSDIERDHWTREFAKALQVEEKVLLGVLQKASDQFEGRHMGEKAPIEEKNVFSKRSESLRERLIGLLLVHPDVKDNVLPSLERVEMFLRSHPASRYIGVAPDAPDAAEQQDVSKLFFEAERFLETASNTDEPFNHEKLFREIANDLAAELRKEEQTDVAALMDEAKKKGDRDAEQALMKRFMELSQET